MTFASMSLPDNQHSGKEYYISANTCVNSSLKNTSMIYFTTMCYGYSLSLWQQEASKGVTVFLESKQDTFRFSLTNK